MPKLGYYVKGDWNAQCDECGLGYKFSGLRVRWDNAMVCRSCWEPRQPQDFVRSVKDDPSVPIARPRTISLGTPGFWSSTVQDPVPWSNTPGFIVPWTGS